MRGSGAGLLTLQKTAWVLARPSRRIGNLTSQLPTMFWILNSCVIGDKT